MPKENEKYRILLVDDEEEFLTASSQALQRRNLDIEVAPNGVTALELVEKNQYDAIVLDVKMPDIDGIEVFQIIHDKHPDLPVILLTGHASIDDAFHTARDGVADYLSKPIDMDYMAKRIYEVIGKWREKGRTDAEKPATESDLGIVRVMLIDDEVEFLKSMSRVLERRNMEVITADNGELGLALLRDELVDVVVLDVKMPWMEGLEVLMRIKNEFPSIQVIMLTGHPSHDAAIEAIKQGAHEYLEKPPDAQKLAVTIRKLFEHRLEMIQEQKAKLVEEIRGRYPD